MHDTVASNAAATGPRTVFGIEFSTLGADGIADIIAGDPPSPQDGPRLLVTANLDHIVQLTRNAAFRDAYRHAWMAVVDGTPVFLYARLRGLTIPARVTGADLFPLILSRLRPGKHRMALVCSSDSTARALRAQLSQLGFADPLIVTAPAHFEDDQAFSRDLLLALRERRVTHLFLGLGAPKSEVWMDRHRTELPPCYGFAFGAGLDFLAGTKRRAPALMRRIGAEFLWRVASEPRRLFKRYFVSSWTFLRVVAADLAGRALL